MKTNILKLMLLAILGLFIICILLVVCTNSNAETETWKQTSWADFSGGEMEDVEVIEEEEDTFLQLKTSENWGEFVRIDDGPDKGLHSAEAAWDSKRNQVVLFGGYSDEYKNDTWIYDPAVDIYIKSKSEINPPARKDHSIVYDSVYDKFVLFGGFSMSEPKNKQDTWIYDPETDSWQEVYPLNHPSPRSKHAMTYDVQNEVVVLFGGKITSNLFQDTWTYNVKNNIWLEKSPIVKPSARYEHAMTYDSANNVIVLFGGGHTNTNETWIYDTGEDTWTEMSPLNKPLKRHSHSLVYDSNNNEVVLFGGFYSEYLNDIWTYSVLKNKWTQKFTSIKPTPRDNFAMVFDDSNGKLLIFGGPVDLHDKHANFIVEDVDTSSDGRWNDISIDHKGYPHISYFDDSDNNLMYTNWNGTGWTTSKIDGNVLDGPNAIVHDLRDFPHILYRSSGGDLYHSYENSSGWFKEVVDNNHDDTTGLGLDLEIDKFGILHAVYCYKINPASSHLYYAYKSDSWSTPKALDMSGKTGIFPSIDVDLIGNPHISYEMVSIQGSMLLYITSSDGGINWNSIETVDGEVTEEYCYSSIAVDPARIPYISYTDYGGVLGFAYKYGSIWGIETISPLTYGYHNSLALDRNGRPHITSGSSGQKNYTFLDRNGNWYSSFLDGSSSNYTTSCKFDSIGRLYIAFISDADYLQYAKLMLPNWEYDLSENEWTPRGYTRDGPSKRYSQSLIYDKEAKKMVLFGGYDNDETLDGTKRNNETWIYDPETRIWQKQFPILKPSARLGHAMVYDTTHEVSILFGGYDGVGNYKNDTWIYDLGSNLWTNITPTKSPPARLGHAMAFHSELGKIVMFGGNNGSAMGDTWTYDYSNNEWYELKPYSNPSKRNGHSMAYDSNENIILLACGSSTFGDDTWTFNYEWNDKLLLREPNKLWYYDMTFDSEKNRFFLFGGYSQLYPYPTLNTIWTYSISDNKWTIISSQNKPSARSGHSMAYTEDYEVTVLFGGDTVYLNSTTREYQFDTYHYCSDNYETIGIYTSQPYAVHPDRGVKWGTIHWNAEVPIGADVEFQVAVSNDDSTWNFVGPDGTSNTFYNDATGGDLSSLSYGKWIRYKAFLRSAQAGDTPELHDVTITWREIEDSTVFLYSPNGGEDLLKEKYHTITWNATGDLLENPINLYFSTNGGKTWTLIASDLENNGTYNWTVPNIETETGLVKVTCVDIYGNNISDVSDMTFAIDPPKDVILKQENQDEEVPEIEPINEENEKYENPEGNAIKNENMGENSSVSVFSAITGCLIVIFVIIMVINRKIRKRKEYKKKEIDK